MTARIFRPRVPWVESPWFEQEAAERNLSAERLAQATLFNRDGYLVLEGLVSDDLRARVRAETTDALRDGDRVQDAWRTSPAVRELATLPAVTEILGDLYGRRPVPFQTLNFQYGTRQLAHSDVVHFNSLPARFMCGVWVALEDTDADNGPLFYYPGSQKMADPVFQYLGLTAGLDSYPQYASVQQALVDRAGYKREEFHARAGDVLIWAANLVHGGQPIRVEGRTRWSQVTHFFFAECVYVTPLSSYPEIGEWLVKDELVDIGTLERVEQSLDGEPIRLEPLAGGLSKIHIGTHRDSEIEALRVEAANLRALADDRQAALDQMTAEADARRAEADAVRSSASYRLGNTAIRPITLVRKRLRRGRQTD